MMLAAVVRTWSAKRNMGTDERVLTRERWEIVWTRENIEIRWDQIDKMVSEKIPPLNECSFRAPTCSKEPNATLVWCECFRWLFIPMLKKSEYLPSPLAGSTLNLDPPRRFANRIRYVSVSSEEGWKTSSRRYSDKFPGFLYICWVPIQILHNNYNS